MDLTVTLNPRKLDYKVEVLVGGKVLHVAESMNAARDWCLTTYKPKSVVDHTMDNFFKGKNVVVTGRMHATRDVIEAELTAVGAWVQKAVTGTTDYLICGADVGERKTRAAEAKGVKMLNRDDYRKAMSGIDFADKPAEAIKPKLTHEEFVASLPESYGDW